MYEFLPIGTIIKIKNKDEKYMIVGKYVFSEDGFFDYNCIPYPYGYMRLMEPIKINNQEIEIVYQLGDINY